jgi:hypothetical protein
MPRTRRKDIGNNAHIDSETTDHKLIHEPAVGSSPPHWYWTTTPHPTLLNGNAADAYFGIMVDEVTKGKWKYNDCTNDSFHGDYKYVAPGGGVFGVSYYNTWCDPELNAGSDAYIRANRSVCEAMRSALQRNAPRPASVTQLEQLFLSPQLPRKVQIDRDPFDTDFSIWYLLVDIVQFWKSFRKITGHRALRGREHYFSEKRLVRIKNRRKHFSEFRDPNSLREKTAKEIANSHLGTQFGIIPLIADIADTINVIRTWREKYDDAKTILSKRYKRHQPKVSLQGLFPNWEEYVEFNVPFTNSLYPMGGIVKSNTHSEWHGMALYGFDAPEFSGFITRLAQLVDSFGILDPQAIWDAVPFSFVVDWFFTTQQWMKKYKPKLFPAMARLYDYLESIQATTILSYKVTKAWYTPTYISGPSRPVAYPFQGYIGSETFKAYARHRFQPDLAAVEVVSGLHLKRNRNAAVDINRTAIASSLIAQRLPR